MFNAGKILRKSLKWELSKKKTFVNKSLAVSKTLNKKNFHFKPIPITWEGLLIILTASVLFIFGSSTCFFTYKFNFSNKNLTLNQKISNTSNINLINSSRSGFHFLKILIYELMGSILMAIGIFLLIILFVITCELRDKAVPIKNLNRKNNFIFRTRSFYHSLDFYKCVVKFSQFNSQKQNYQKH